MNCRLARALWSENDAEVARAVACHRRNLSALPASRAWSVGVGPTLGNCFLDDLAGLSAAQNSLRHQSPCYRIDRLAKRRPVQQFFCLGCEPSKLLFHPFVEVSALVTELALEQIIDQRQGLRLVTESTKACMQCLGVEAHFCPSARQIDDDFLFDGFRGVTIDLYCARLPDAFLWVNGNQPQCAPKMPRCDSVSCLVQGE